ncbi:MAG: hypothetical protein M3O61_11250 [Gemmatimonadota bacterium]|nr:hypothetical protein [Gemmatimonadota bacterium]
MRAQGNRFIKELLREKDIRIGTNKDDFELNLTHAIESGKLGVDDVERWILEREGPG